MKLFSRFLVEAESSKVSDQAKKLNLKSDGHGGWYDSRGEFVAKTEGGKLKFYNQRQRAGQDPPQNRGGHQAQGGQAKGAGKGSHKGCPLKVRAMVLHDAKLAKPQSM